MYRISNCSGDIYKDDVIINGDTVLMDEYNAYLSNDGKLEFFDGTESEINSEKAGKFIADLQLIATDLRIRAKAAAIDKTGPNGYIVGQEEMYRLKYRIATGAVTNSYIENLMLNEASEFGITYEQFKSLVIQKFEAAEVVYNVFLYMIERCRTKIQTLIENANWIAVETAFDLARSLTHKDQAEPIVEQILSL